MKINKIKIWTAVDRRRNKVITYEISINSHNNDNIICARLLDKVKKDYIINIIATDGNYSYNKVINHNTKDCNKHIISKKETCLVESYNSSIRDTFARFRRKTKCYSPSIKMVYYSMLMWSNYYILNELLNSNSFNI